MPVAELYEICARVRELMTGEHAVGRVIARPFDGRGRRVRAHPAPPRLRAPAADGAAISTRCRPARAASTRSARSRSCSPAAGIDAAHPGATNAEAIASTTALLERLDDGFVFTNLIETDQVYGHRKDVAGFHAALREIDAAVARWLDAAAAPTTCSC